MFGQDSPNRGSESADERSDVQGVVVALLAAMLREDLAAADVLIRSVPPLALAANLGGLALKVGVLHWGRDGFAEMLAGWTPTAGFPKIPPPGSESVGT